MRKAYTTTVLTSGGDPFEASFFITQDLAGAGEHVVHMERLEATFEFDEDARTAADQAANAYVDTL
jgi:hypothetical protein